MNAKQVGKAVKVGLCYVVAFATVLNGLQALANCDNSSYRTAAPLIQIHGGSGSLGYQDLSGCNPVCGGTCLVTDIEQIYYCGSIPYGQSGGCMATTTLTSAKSGACGAQVTGDGRGCGCRNVSQNATTVTVSTAVSC